MIKRISISIAFTILCITAYAQKKVLFVMSSANELPLKNGKVFRETGVFLSEFYPAYKAIKGLGYEIDIATPNGIKPFIDKESLDRKYWKDNETLLPEALDFVELNQTFNSPQAIEAMLTRINGYSGLVIPGGQGLMADLINDKNTALLLVAFADGGKPVGLICHAPALILSIPSALNPFIGYKVNSVSGLEEVFIETLVLKGKPVNRKIGRQLARLGLRYRRGRPAGNFAIRDRELITSQNPYSNQAFISLYLEALNDYKLKGTLK